MKPWSEWRRKTCSEARHPMLRPRLSNLGGWSRLAGDFSRSALPPSKLVARCQGRTELFIDPRVLLLPAGAS